MKPFDSNPSTQRRSKCKDLFFLFVIVLNVSISADNDPEPQNEDEKNSIEGEQQEIQKDSSVSNWTYQTKQAWEALKESEDTEEYSQAKSDFETSYFQALNLYRQGTDNIKSELRDEVLFWSCHWFHQSLLSQKMEQAGHILKSFDQVSRTIGIGERIAIGLESGREHSMREGFAAEIIVYMIAESDYRYEPLFKKLTPETITGNLLAFNIACLHSLRGNKQEMLKYIKLAIDLGKDKSNFRREQDFKKYWKDPDFLKLVKE
ncbi:TPR end-of-group domain-containing protein [Leptospira santarosai]|uniref:TPR end-of-group domain-containing protein n=1 Tax=Leptospira santarosai TaxID=28183 RepID=UPI00062D051C|nr:hypothetical protein [Leptospira santarosai]AVV79000.1 Uncharacterized protein XB15_01215 [Leptospira santarosai]ONF89309.1 hypothetical protein BWD13_02770 [Leptospira santarosai serovar Grippotyphosa]